MLNILYDDDDDIEFISTKKGSDPFARAGRK